MFAVRVGQTKAIKQRRKNRVPVIKVSNEWRDPRNELKAVWGAVAVDKCAAFGDAGRFDTPTEREGAALPAARFAANWARARRVGAFDALLW